MECLKTGYTEIWTASAVVPLMDFAHHAESIDSTGLNWLELPDTDPPPALLPRLRSFHSIVSWYGAGRPQFRNRVAELGLPFTFLPALPHTTGGAHAVDFYFQQVQGLKEEGVAVPPYPLIRCGRREGDFAVIHPFASSRAKQWPLERFRALAEILGRRMPVFWCAGPEEELPDAVRYGNLRDLAGWLAGARLFIGNDSGIGHLAAAVGTPVVSLFGPTDPAVWAPRGERVAVLRSGTCMTEIPVHAVVESVCHLLG